MAAINLVSCWGRTEHKKITLASGRSLGFPRQTCGVSTLPRAPMHMLCGVPALPGEPDGDMGGVGGGLSHIPIYIKLPLRHGCSDHF